MKTTDIATITRTRWTRTLSLLTLLSLPHAGCDAPQSVAEAAEVPGVEGLKLQMEDDHIEGSLTRGGATVHFVIERDGQARTAQLSADDGSPLLESVAEAGKETVTLFGGRAVLSGDPSGEPQVEGDPDALDELREMPEGQPIADLHAALEEAGVDPVLLGAELAEDEVTSRLYNDGVYWNLGFGESVQVGTWGWITYTTIAMRHYANYNLCVQFQAGAGGWANLCGPSGVETKKAYQFWGALLVIANNNWNTTVKVRTY